jgi:hypothetical protein
MPDAITNNKNFIGKRVKSSCKVNFVNPPHAGQTYPQSNGYPVQLIKIEILKE